MDSFVGAVWPAAESAVSANTAGMGNREIKRAWRPGARPFPVILDLYRSCPL